MTFAQQFEQQGFRLGFQQGFRHGIEQGMRETAKNMLQEGLHAELVGRITGLNQQDIDELVPSLTQFTMH